MTEVVQFPEKVATDQYFGGCPTCGKNDGYLNFKRNHWMVCHKHKTRWWVGSNLFSSWREETETDWERNAQRMEGYAEVAPVSPDTTECDRCGETGLKDCIDIHHSPLCQKDGKLTELSEEERREDTEMRLTVLHPQHQQGHSHRKQRPLRDMWASPTAWASAGRASSAAPTAGVEQGAVNEKRRRE